MLRERYSDDFLKLAQERKDRLQYEKLTVGRRTDVRVDHILNLLYQTHQNYYFAFNEAAVCLSGILIEQALMVLLEEKLNLKGRLTINFKGKTFTATGPKELNHKNLGLLIEFAFQYQICNKIQYEQLRHLQLIRNTSIHGLLPEWELNEELHYYETKIDKQILKIDQAELSSHTLSQDSNEIWAYFTLTQTRQLIEELFRPRATRLPPRLNENPPDAL